MPKMSWTTIHGCISLRATTSLTCRLWYAAHDKKTVVSAVKLECLSLLPLFLKVLWLVNHFKGYIIFGIGDNLYWLSVFSKSLRRRHRKGKATIMWDSIIHGRYHLQTRTWIDSSIISTLPSIWRATWLPERVLLLFSDEVSKPMITILCLFAS